MWVLFALESAGYVVSRLASPRASRRVGLAMSEAETVGPACIKLEESAVQQCKDAFAQQKG